MHNSLGFRKNNNQKLTVNINNRLLSSNKKNDNSKYYYEKTNSNTKLLYEKMKKKTYYNTLKKNKEKPELKSKFGKINNKETISQNKNSSYKFIKFSNLTTRKRKNTVRTINKNKFSFKFTNNEKNNITEKETERRYSFSTIHRPILTLDEIATSYNEMKEKRNKIINKFKGEKISPRQQSLYILATSPVLRLCEQIIFSHASENLKKVLSIDNILKNHNIFLNAKANELQNEICLCEKRINTPFVASKIADITLNFIQNRDEIDFMTLSDNYGENNDEMKDYYNYVKLDGIAIGNHEFDYGVEKLKDHIKDEKFPTLCANLYDKSKKKYVWDGLCENVKPYEIYTLGTNPEIKIGVIGLATAETITFTSTDLSNYSFDNYYDVTKYWTDYLRKEKEVDAVVLLTHFGPKCPQEPIKKMYLDMRDKNYPQEGCDPDEEIMKFLYKIESEELKIDALIGAHAMM